MSLGLKDHRFQYPTLSHHNLLTYFSNDFLVFTPDTSFSLVPHLPSPKCVLSPVVLLPPLNLIITSLPPHQHFSLPPTYPPTIPTLHITWPLDKGHRTSHLFSHLIQGTEPCWRKSQYPKNQCSLASGNHQGLLFTHLLANVKFPFPSMQWLS